MTSNHRVEGSSPSWRATQQPCFLLTIDRPISSIGHLVCGGCSSVGRALDCDSSCRGFKSLHSPHLTMIDSIVDVLVGLPARVAIVESFLIFGFQQRDDNLSLLTDEAFNPRIIVGYSCCARVAELADALDLGSSGQPWEFESPLSHQKKSGAIVPLFCLRFSGLSGYRYFNQVRLSA